MEQVERIRVAGISLGLEEEKNRIIEKAIQKLKIRESDVISWQIRRESVDARKRSQVRLIYTADILLKPGVRKKCMDRGIKTETPPDETYRLPVPPPERHSLVHPPVVMGFGPCGMFAALILAEAGYRPVVLERGQSIEKREADVEQFWQTGCLKQESNVLFGEGGAGAFSDGKLTTRIKDVRIEKVIDILINAGAPEEIRYKQKPHIGTDLLKNIVRTIRKQILDMGGEVRFGCKLIAVEKDQEGRLCAIRTADGARLPAEALLAAPGHSARDTIRQLYQCGIEMEQKPFSMGVRIEHFQGHIDSVQFGAEAGHPKIGAAEYSLSCRSAGGRGVYTFCMCPGGQVIAASSEEGGVVTNGMSFHDRAGVNANSALLVDVRTEDFEDEHPLAGIAFQQKWERRAYIAGGSSYAAPAQRLGDFMDAAEAKKKPKSMQQSQNMPPPQLPLSKTYVSPQKTRPECNDKVEPTYRPGVTWTELTDCLPEFVSEALREAIPALGRKLRGFDDPEAVMTAIESRSSSPVRMRRGADMQSSVAGLYPAGEGAGYAGGITSAAVDGIKAAEQIIMKFAPPKRQ